MLQTTDLESAIRQELARVGSCTSDELAFKLPGYTWTKVASTVNRLADEGTVVIKYPGPFRCIISLPPC